MVNYLKFSVVLISCFVAALLGVVQAAVPPALQPLETNLQALQTQLVALRSRLAAQPQLAPQIQALEDQITQNLEQQTLAVQAGLTTQPGDPALTAHQQKVAQALVKHKAEIAANSPAVQNALSGIAGVNQNQAAQTAGAAAVVGTQTILTKVGLVEEGDKGGTDYEQDPISPYIFPCLLCNNESSFVGTYRL